MNNHKTVSSKLQLQELNFDKIKFKRIGEKNENKIEQKIIVKIGENKDREFYKVVLELITNKPEEYETEICVHGIFTFASDGMLDEEMKKSLIQKNAVAIMMPYVRSQLTLLTSQPGVDPIVMPPLNINAMLDDAH